MVMGWIWTAMVGLSLFCAALNGRGPALAGALAEGGKQAVELGLLLAGSLCLWSGFAELLRRSGLRARLSRLLSPLLGRLFPTARQDREVMGALSGNVTANLLGLGNAATPLGIAAVRRMQLLSGGAEATDEMCLLIVMNTASIQLLPTTAAALRASLGAPSPFSILPAVWVSSLLSVTAGILAAKGLRRVWR